MTIQTTPSAVYIGPYRVIRQIGAGGMGQVHLAASRSGRAVAVKVVRPELAADPDFRRRFKAEVDAARAVGGAFTAPVVDADPDGPQPWLATAYIPGPALSEALDSHGPMPETTLRVLGAGLAEALAAIHRAGLIHRDLKPSNILLTHDGPRVIDFGISRAIDSTMLTAEGQVIGSPGFISPEQSRGGELTPASDVFALGGVLAFAATGTPPFGTGAAHALLYRAVHEAPQLDGVPPALLGTVAACLDKDPARRPTVEQLQAWLRPATSVGWLGAIEFQVTASERTLNDEVRRPGIGRRRLLIGGAALTTTAAAGTAAWLLRPDDEKASGGQGQGAASALPRLSWTADLPHAPLYPRALTKSTVLCLGENAGACFDRASGRLLWQDTNGVDFYAAADDQRVYTARADGKIHALNGRTGKELWATDLPGSGAVTPKFTDGSLLVTTDQRRYQTLDTADGTVRWQTPDIGALAVAGMTRDGRPILWNTAAQPKASARYGDYSVVSPDTGELLWSKDLEKLYAPPASDVLYGIDSDMNLLAIDAADGSTRWSKPARLPSATRQFLVFLTLELHQGVLYGYQDTESTRATAGVVAAFDPATGNTLWSRTTTAPDKGGFAHSGATVCYLDKVLRAVGAKTGTDRWTAGSGLGELTFLGALSGLYIAATNKGLYGFDDATGKQAWHYPVSGVSGEWTTPLFSDDQFVVGSSGKLFHFSAPKGKTASPAA
ncbi:outer membrane protein assembly factor BamB family protein [Streptomyces beijiangensis]|uniref:Serine/threonine-protein kinase n=1 Tax=Streptomyces beijiangensis TaxID=163361 RepID=A0A939FFG1_9ACTN|nr:PQQ-binding-like beta-propeller repeat protein [Streptomyces beijiangensis]MBO0517394.1 serine/threonine-protein kinase [Streptomyces beijiangensis]